MIRLITDSVASIPADVAERENIRVISMFLHEGDKEHVETTMDIDEFYDRIGDMVDNIPTSSQPPMGELEDMFEEAAQAGDSVIAVFITMGLSGTAANAASVAEKVKARHAGFDIVVIDSGSCGLDEGFCVLECAKAIKEGKSFEECVQITVDAAARSRFVFAPQTLAFLKAGGRIGHAAALLGSLIQLTPILTVVNGIVEAPVKVRTYKRAKRAIVDQLKRDMDECGLQECVVQYIGPKSAAVDFAKEYVEPLLGHAVDIIPVSPCVGLHVGPTVAVAYIAQRKLPGKIDDPNSLIYRI
ncbi:DegV family protein [Slackia heliotrinireducens]|uniref:Uncharacterized conserved protein n=1 Tax=Slackia heliotrinireducens (strain ATCC 29202 / DSM 20476 / NCTC 11029 / RHS 1) TaxID=471855 RepID=C7N6U9_SLAHD|nr:DegV family protein [Slackia heliotrinireducens]ACV22634.1 uncharacterized conserved protein [Slackia heliotrinireducens DSM 20476]VEH01176.1 EDD domain protein, DegV family [Slackia heliotrinireducens]